MATNSRQKKWQEKALSSLNVAIEVLNLAKEISSITPAKAVFGVASILLAMIRDLMASEQDYVELGLSCAHVCQVLERGLNERQTDDLNKSVLTAIEKLTTTVEAIQNKIVKQGERNAVSRFFHSRADQASIAGWGRDFDRILHIFNAEFSINNHVVLVDIRHDVRAALAGTDGRSTQASTPLGELPPPQPRACFGRDGLIEQIVDLADALTPIALIGPGGIGKTSVALAVLHHDRAKERFGENRRFIRCDKFPVSRSNFLRRLSKVVGAGVENPEDLDALRSFLSSKAMLIILDNAESILDPQGTDGKEIYHVVEELSQFTNICLVITSRITTVPPDCETLEVPRLSMEAAHNTFYRIYKYGGQSDGINDILSRLDYHPLSVTLLATVAQQNKWDNSRLAEEWERRQTGVLQTVHNNSLAATIELSLASPMFRELGPEARGLLGVVAFFPQGVDEKNLGWLFPAIPGINTIFDKFCILSLAYRSGGFVTMLAPLRDYLRPTNPTQSPLLCSTKDLYLTRLAVVVDIDLPTFGETRWILSEDANVEHLLDVFTFIDANSEVIWDACANFMEHLYWHKLRQTILRSKVERLPDDHPSKPNCLFWLSRLFHAMGNYTEQKSLLLCLLALGRKEGNDLEVARTLRELSDANRMLGLYEEGIREAKEALEIMERVGGDYSRAMCLVSLAKLLGNNNQLDAAEDAISGAIHLWEEGQEFDICQSHRILGAIYHRKGEREKAVQNFEVALGIASRFKWHREIFWIHHDMALFYYEDELDDTQAHITQAKLHTVDDKYCLGNAMGLQAWIWLHQGSLEDAMSEALGAKEICEKLGAAVGLGGVRDLIQAIEEEMERRATAVASESIDHSASEHPDE
ncbi:hypothetical protein BJ322DRAFT_1111675 [Thelephora terrestris]|uniref:Novel STAND NTPase 1 domain-containing protein n=1 Tax=Thelephora terrestris TaxID=56493 RepID=A0A9P6H999_9AGAM|nr:hypothetical protein BJ322DRAFT_1111675 [Thelephora terrestris]